MTPSERGSIGKARDMTATRRVGGAAIVLVTLVATIVLSNLRVPADSTDAMVRLSWRIDPVAIEECRTRSEEELARLAPHMRQEEVCEGRHAHYELEFSVDGQRAAFDTLVPAGFRHDRPVFVLSELTVPPGPADVEVRFTALVPETFEADGVPVSYEWQGRLELEPRQIGLITMDEEGRRLIQR